MHKAFRVAIAACDLYVYYVFACVLASFIKLAGVSHVAIHISFNMFIFDPLR